MYRFYDGLPLYLMIDVFALEEKIILHYCINYIFYNMSGKGSILFLTSNEIDTNPIHHFVYLLS